MTWPSGRPPGDLEDRAEAVGLGLVRPEDAEDLRVARHDVAQEAAEHARRLAARAGRLGHLDRVVAEVGQPQVLSQQPAVGLRDGAHPPVALGRRRQHVVARRAVVAEQLVRPVRAHPRLELGERLRVLAQVAERDLVGSRRALARARPALRGAQHDHRPARPLAVAVLAGAPLDLRDLVERLVERGGHALVHVLRVVALDEDRPVPVALEQRGELVVRDLRQHGRVGDLEAVQVQDGQDGAVARRVEELVAVPARGERTGLGLAVADDAQHDEVRVVERRAVGVRERVAELAALVDRARRLRRDVARDAAGERELAEQAPHALLVAADLGVDLAVGALEPRAGDERRDRRGRAR